jgi:SAM-dependent methyltransferase
VTHPVRRPRDRVGAQIDPEAAHGGGVYDGAISPRRAKMVAMSSRGRSRTRRALGWIFDEDAATYDAMRPTYPSALFDDLFRLASIRPESRVLEIGAGTGQATVDLARRGSHIVALEPGPLLARIAAEKLRPFPRARIEVSTFEAWRPPDAPFDAIVAATSFHWLDPASRLTKCAEILREGGVLAIISTHHVAGGTAEFFRDVQACYERHMPGTEPGLRLPSETAIPVEDEGLEHAPAFFGVRHLDHPREETYSSEAYRRLLMTYSGHRALDQEQRSGLLDCIGRLVDDRFGGRITKRYLFRLTIARRTERSAVDQ